jgi:dipeptidase
MKRGFTMCDTLGATGKSCVLFGKNSDRCVSEPQIVEFHKAKINEHSTLKATYIEIEQVKETKAVLLSRPSWMWGAEMGVNQCGVTIGNEAIFTKGKYSNTGLTGMDLLRLALERSENAKGALDTVISLLERYGQGGNCGYDSPVFYNNSFLIMDKTELYILETYNKKWAYRKSDKDSISNRMCVRKDAVCSNEPGVDFASRHTEPIYTFLCGSGERRKSTQECLMTDPDVSNFMNVLRNHKRSKDPFAGGTANSVCMHAGGVVNNQTTASMIVEISDTPLVWVTGSSLPCVSLYKPYLFGNDPVAPVFNENDNNAQEYWLKREKFNRRLLGNSIPAKYYTERNELEAKWIDEAHKNISDKEAMAGLSRKACMEEEDFFLRWSGSIAKKEKPTFMHMGFWDNRNV